MTLESACGDALSSGWYVAYTRPRQEARALENLQNQGFDCLLPTLMADCLRDGKRVQLQEPLFPRYLFVWLEAGKSKWSLIRSTRGVVRLVEFGGRPARVCQALIDALKTLHAPDKPLFEPGDQLKVMEGPFTGIEAELLRVYEMPDGEARVMVLIDIMSRPQQLSLPASIVRLKT